MTDLKKDDASSYAKTSAKRFAAAASFSAVICSES
jgi:hypothetical protein